MDIEFRTEEAERELLKALHQRVTALLNPSADESTADDDEGE